MIPCHKLFLATNSGYFARMLDSVWNEAQKGEVEIEEFQQEEVEALIKFCYTNEIDEKVYADDGDDLFNIRP